MPKKIILFPVNKAFINSMMGCVLGPFESRWAWNGCGFGEGDEGLKVVISLISEN